MQLAFSPSQNLLAWTDSEGILTWWKEPVPSDSPHPVKQSVAAEIPANVKATSTPRGDDGNGNAIGASSKNAHAGLNDDGNQYDDDWIIDDLGDGMVDEPEEGRRKRGGDGFVKEMGMLTVMNWSVDETNFVRVVSITKAQPAFQPGSTPMENKRRYLGRQLFYLQCESE